MNAIEFLLWLKGVRDAVGGRTPSADEWKLISERIDKEIGSVVADRILRDNSHDYYRHVDPIYKPSQPAAPKPWVPRDWYWSTDGTGEPPP